MTHLSDFSFLQRAIGLSYVLLWFLYRIQITGGYSCLYMHRFKRGELKTIVTALILVMLPFQLYYGKCTLWHLYEEGFVQILGHIVTKPEFLWTQADRDLITPTDYSLCIGFSLQIGTLLLLQCFWKYLAKLVARATFMTSKEFKFYIIMTIVNIILFPVLQYNFSRDIYNYTYKEIMPQLVYGCELMLISMLGGVSHFRFRKLLSNSQYRNDAQFITHKMKYFQDLNLLLSVALFIFSLCFIILSADGLTAKKTINMHKFAADFLICNINITCIIVWVIVILIFHPKKTVEEHTRIPDTSFSSSSSTEQDTKIHQYK
ncbi:hypothetical protein INT47_005290 [Mucor saturninus]|uniref:Uncharacterized protein n=1 Tax=Mucor saturninus TaxID=64648 RepID=A0A8H7V588_9FUNG|nr:hypothetical protein INT47_005290 [Mucor saturninus]